MWLLLYRYSPVSGSVFPTVSEFGQLGNSIVIARLPECSGGWLYVALGVVWGTLLVQLSPPEERDGGTGAVRRALVPLACFWGVKFWWWVPDNLGWGVWANKNRVPPLARGSNRYSFACGFPPAR